MIHSIFGKISGKQENSVCILTHGIEWDIIISRITAGNLPEMGSEYKIYVFLYHREDQLQLFGFHDLKEKNLFLNLIKVEGIGPSQAMKILSGITPANFIKALETQDIGRLEEIRGLGKKTAQKIMLKLAGKLTLGEKENKTHTDIVKALTGMGFDVQISRKAVSAAAAEIDEHNISKDELEKRLLKAALEKLSKG